MIHDKITLIDDEDYDWLNQWTWNVDSRGLYVIRKEKRIYKNGKIHRPLILMHRLIMNAPKNMEVDHIDGNGLNNQRSNLRIVTRRQNMQNLHKSKSSIYPGVSWNQHDKAWRVAIRIKNVKGRKYIGNFKTELEAYNAYCDALCMIGEVPLPLPEGMLL